MFHPHPNAAAVAAAAAAAAANADLPPRGPAAAAKFVPIDGGAIAAVGVHQQHPHHQDKRNRNPNWTDGEIIRFLEILQEEPVMRDLMAQRNKQVFCYVATRLNAEGAEKTWDQCRIKLKNLKSQFRYIRERVPAVSALDLEDDAVTKRLVHECQLRGISPSSLKHLRYLKRFLSALGDYKSKFPTGGGGGVPTPAANNSNGAEETEILTNSTLPQRKSALGKPYLAFHIPACSLHLEFLHLPSTIRTPS